MNFELLENVSCGCCQAGHEVSAWYVRRPPPYRQGATLLQWLIAPRKGVPGGVG